MAKNRNTSLAIFFILSLLLFALDSWQTSHAEKPTPGGFTFQASEPAIPKISLAVRDLTPTGGTPRLDQQSLPLLWLGENLGTTGHLVPQDPLAPYSTNENQTPPPLLTFEGLGSDGLAPPDPVGDVGPYHFIQMVNVSFQIWDKGDPDNGIPPTILQPDTSFNQLFTGFGGPCETQNNGDPIVLYDDMADRWLLSQFALTTPNWMCLAISTSPDPTGTYYLYTFSMPTTPDYPKFGAWNDAYFLGTNSGLPNQFYTHAFDKARMLAGLPATRQSFGGLANFVMPADADGQIAPPEDAPGILYTMFAQGYVDHPPGVDRLAIYEIDIDWEIPGNSSLSLTQEIPIADFNYTVCGYFVQNCIPQPSTPQTLDSLSYWPMFRFQYRNFGNFAGLVGNFTVDLNNTNKAAIRWFELRKIGNTYTLHQQGTYAPDNAHRWMGSIALDRQGNIALGYSVGGPELLPSLRFATREVDDPPGSLAQEAELQTGGGVQTGIVRWGDYSNMVVDPVDGCTFWFTGEYHDQDDSGFNWNTRIGIFRIPTCEGETGTLTGRVTDSSTGSGLSGVRIEARSTITQTGLTETGENGGYALGLPQGTYVVTATLYGFLPEVTNGIEIISGTITLQDFNLAPANFREIEGIVTDSLTGWPLYAKITVNDPPGTTVWTEPGSGYYHLNLPEGEYEFQISSWSQGYFPLIEPVNVIENTTRNFSLVVDAGKCVAPGYEFNGTREGFDEAKIPEGWAVLDFTQPPTGQVWRFDDPSPRGNLTGGTGGFAIVDSDYEGGIQDTALITPQFDFSGQSNVWLTFDTDLNIWEAGGEEIADVDVRVDQVDIWTNVWRRTQPDGDFNGRVTIDISQIAGGEGFVYVRFHYYNANYDYWWEVDNVNIGLLTCDPLPGGLVVGQVTDLNTGGGLSGATISNLTGDTVLTVNTPDDPDLGDGFYLLFTSPGIETYTATLSSNYGTLTQTVSVGDGQTVRVDYPLPAGWLVSSQETVELHLGLGYSATIDMEIENIGTRIASYSLLEDKNLQDVPWLILNPVTGSLDIAQSQVVTITLVTQEISQTGIYTTFIKGVSDTPYDPILIPVTLNAEEPFGAVGAGPDQEKSGVPGATLVYTVTITNTGNIPQVFQIQTSLNQWDITTSENQIFLNPGSSQILVVTIVIPENAWHGEKDQVLISVIGSHLPTISDSVILTAVALFPHEMYFPFVLGE